VRTGVQDQPARTTQGDYEDLADLYNAANPTSDVQRALVAGYWFQVVEGNTTFASQTLNTALKDLGHGLSNITKALTALQQQRPALASQVKKAGKSRQARKVYKLTRAGITEVERMLAGDFAAQ
jgi:hypothetical protein